MWEVVTLALGQAAGPLLKKAAERHVERFFGDRIDDLARRGRKKSLVKAMERAWRECLDLILREVRYLGDFEDDDPDFRAYFEPLRSYVDQDLVGSELLKPILEVDRDAPDPHELRFGWDYLDGAPAMPEGFSWTRIAQRYRKALAGQRILSAELRPQLDSENLDAVRQLLEGVAGVQPEGDVRRYAERMREKYRVLDLSAMLPPTAEDGGPILLRHAFVPQKVRENPPPVELPRDLLQRLAADGSLPEDAAEALSAGQLERLRESYIESPAEPVLEVVAAPPNRKLVFLGGPGSGKSTLTRYLLLSGLDPAADRRGWPAGLRGHLPLLVELREFQVVYHDKRCNNFLQYWHYLGSTQKYHLDEGWLHERLSAEPSLVLFDGLDEIFEARERERVMHAIAGFAGEYPRARVVVTSRPVGYRDAVLRAADFRHYALEDLDDEQVRLFVDGWFGHLFPDRPEDAELRRRRILDAAEKSRSIRLLAGNPMLLTIMAMIAQLRELPRERWRFYHHAAEVLCHHWDVNRHLEAEGIPEYIGLEDKKELLERIAGHMQEGDGGLAANVIREGELRRVVEGYLGERYGLAPAPAKSVAGGLIGQLRERNYVLCLRGPRLYGFVHRTFLEYFSATGLVRRVRDDPDYGVERLRDEVFARYWREESWCEVLRLVAGMLGERQAAVLIRYLARDAFPRWRLYLNEDPPQNLALAVECLAEVRNLHVVEEECREVLQALLDAVRFPGSYEGRALRQLLANRVLPATEEFRLTAMLESWFTLAAEETFRKLVSLALQHPVATLATVWITDRKIVVMRATQDENEYVRNVAISALARGWPDRDTRELIASWATQNEHASVRSTAISALARGWPDRDDTRELIAARATQDENKYARSAAVGALGRLLLDHRAVVLLSRYLDGAYPFLDPLEPISPEHLQRGAQKLGMSIEEARELLAACEPKLGWNPLRP